jgi:hypothetical protein
VWIRSGIALVSVVAPTLQPSQITVPHVWFRGAKVIERWSCESYCLCGSRKGHFEKSETGVWVFYESHAKILSARLQQIETLRDELTACQLERDRQKQLLRKWLIDVGGGSPDLERESWAAINGVPQPVLISHPDK